MYRKLVDIELFIMFRRSKCIRCQTLLIICIIIYCIEQFLTISWASNEKLMTHKSLVYNTSNSFIMTNIIDQFLYTNNDQERDELWSLIVQGWLKFFKLYLKRTEISCSSSLLLSNNDIQQYLEQYQTKLLSNSKIFQKQLTGLGLFFDYDLKEIRFNDHHVLHNVFHSSCTYFELIMLIIKVQLILFELNINYFIGQNTLIGALRHHDIVPWHTIIEFNLPLHSKTKLINNINKKFQLVLEQVNDTYVHEKQIGFIYKISHQNQRWPQIEIYFYQENSKQIFDSNNNKKNLTTMKIGYLNKTDIFPLHFRPFGPIFLHSIRNFQAMISIEQLNNCQSMSWDHRLRKQIDINLQYQISCEQLYRTYSFVQTRSSWRRGYCEETLKARRAPFRTLSYFRNTCQEK